MARGRMINRTITRSRKFNSPLLSDSERLLFCILMPFVDRDGKMEGDTDIVKSICYPRRNDVDEEFIISALMTLSRVGLIEYYNVGEDFYIRICKFRDNQIGLRYGKESASTFPDSSNLPNSLSGIQQEEVRLQSDVVQPQSEVVQSQSEVVQSQSGEVEVEVEVEVEEKRTVKKRNNARFTKPSVKQLTEYCLERKNTVDPYRFFNHYESNGWKIGKASMKDWKAAVRSWEYNDFGKKEKHDNFKAGGVNFDI